MTLGIGHIKSLVAQAIYTHLYHQIRTAGYFTCLIETLNCLMQIFIFILNVLILQIILITHFHGAVTCDSAFGNIGSSSL